MLSGPIRTDLCLFRTAQQGQNRGRQNALEQTNAPPGMWLKFVHSVDEFHLGGCGQLPEGLV
jgi:hypothetical protein